ncbi:hypothetical protein IWQ57_004041 [Coemansia nantahalensis]|uniref:Uncharacterized protein n=2 Tax=Coemansia TaxID=4863 RepID=A0ACC1LB33_9FUNG|nr:hypothetical protein IWQ57_004041 [Coemansia nantahalensis]KAJ2804152.1 hypothetical protein H4R21_001752 [Coemansia helicoidea]
MQIGAWSLVVTAAVLGSAVRGFDFHSDEAARCATEHWDEIRAIVNPKLSMASTVLPAEGLKKIQALLDGKSELPTDPPPRNWLSDAADAIPAPLMNMFGRSVIEKCVNEGKR